MSLPGRPGAILVGDTAEPRAAPATSAVPADRPRNETIAPKGRVNGGVGGGVNSVVDGEAAGESRGLKSPAERLGLFGAARARHEKCLADAIYFEARGEPGRGQMAVAQVVMNRVFSGYYYRSRSTDCE
jgi:hypothetical protein